MNRKTTLAILAMALLAMTPNAIADDGAGPGPEPANDSCPVVAVVPYDPYVVVTPDCLPWPLGQG